MNFDTLRNYCLHKKGVEETFPFDQKTLVFKVMGKMFALIDIEEQASVNLKCDPEKAIELRASYPEAVLPGWHMSKKNWNTVKLHAGLENDQIKAWIDHSYDEVVKGLTKKLREELQNLD